MNMVYIYQLKEPFPLINRRASTMADYLICRECGAKMVKATRFERHIGQMIFGVAGFILGALLFFGRLSLGDMGGLRDSLDWPVEQVLGVFLMLGSVGMGLQRSKIWRCTKCRHTNKRS